MNLRDAKVLVTGGSSGIGLETARLLISKQAKVAICGRDERKLKAAAQTIGAVPVRADVSVEADVIAMVRNVISTLGDYNVLINNAGYGYFAPLTEIELADFQKLFATNVAGAMLAARESARYFVKRNTGNIVNIASTAGQRGYAGGTAYSASKFALNSMTECWRAELRKNNIRVMQVNPSEVITDFFAAAGRSQTPSQRKLRPLEIAHTIVAMLEMDDRGFTTEATVWATNPD